MSRPLSRSEAIFRLHIDAIQICGLTNTTHLTDLYFSDELVNCELHEFVTHSIFQMEKSKRDRQHSLQ